MPISFPIVAVIISCTIIYYLKKLEEIDCRCALNFKHNYILYFTYFNLFFVVIKYLFFKKTAVTKWVFIPILIAQITNTIFTIQYINDVKKNKCQCSESFIREGMYILAIISACAWVLIGFFLSYALTMSPSIFQVKKM
jgi:hypothetical protein